jgi:hypothetical protein
MIFISAMNVLGFLITKAKSEGLLQPLSTRALQHRMPIYVDDVVLFLWPTSEDISMTMNILHVFEEASGLRNNAQKNSVFPICCGELERERERVGTTHAITWRVAICHDRYADLFSYNSRPSNLGIKGC